jgi:hypothetical protein
VTDLQLFCITFFIIAGLTILVVLLIVAYLNKYTYIPTDDWQSKIHSDRRKSAQR